MFRFSAFVALLLTATVSDTRALAVGDITQMVLLANLPTAGRKSTIFGFVVAWFAESRAKSDTTPNSPTASQAA